MSAIEKTETRLRQQRKPPLGEVEAAERSDRPRIETVCLVFLSVVAGVFALRYAQGIFMPFVLGLLFFYALDPIVSWCCRLGLPRIVGSVLLVSLLLGGIGLGVYALRGQAADLLERLPEAARKVTATLEEYTGSTPSPVATVQQVAGELAQAASEAAGSPPIAKGVTRVRVEEPLFRTSDYLWSGSRSAVWLIGQGVTFLFLVLFLLIAGDLYKRKLVEVVGPRLSDKRLTVQILEEIDEQIGNFLLVQFLASAFIGIAMGLVLWLLGVNQAAMWGFLAGVLNFIPYFGSIFVTIGITLVAFRQFGTLSMAAAVAGITLLVTSIDGFLLKPLLTQKFSKMNQLAVFISLLFWGWIWGATGMLLAVPIMVAVKTICDRIEGLQPIGHLLGE